MADGAAGYTQIDRNDPNLIFVDENRSYRLFLYLENEQMDCVLGFEMSPKLESAERNTLLQPPELIGLLVRNQLVGIDFAAVYEFCAAIECGDPYDRLTIARGMSPVRGADGWFELVVKIDGETSCFAEDDFGYVDLKTLNAYSEIEPGWKLGIIHPPGQGIAGLTAHGQPVSPPPGEPCVVRAGEGVELKYDGKIAFSTKSGRALFDQGVLSVVDQLIIPGDLDLTVGNIDFKGFVEVRGDIPDDYVVKSTMGIKVRGFVGASRLESTGSIEIASMAGKGRGTILCRGDLYAAFINHVDLTVFGSVHVTSEIRNSSVRATGKVVVDKGSIIGGECIAMEGIEVKTAGTSSGQKTKLVAGVYFPDNDRFEYLRVRLKNINRQINALNSGVVLLGRYLRRHPSASAAAHKRIQIMKDKLAQLAEEKERRSAEVAASTPQQFESQNPKINIRGRLMEGVTIVLGDSSEEFRQSRSGPTSIIENKRRGGMLFLGLSPLRVSANELDAGLVPGDFETDSEFPA